MPTLQTKQVTEGDIWNRLLQMGKHALTLEAARYLLGLEFAAEDKERMRELAAKARDGSLTAGEREELTNYEHVGNLMALMKSKARQRLKKPVRPNGTGR